MNKTTIRAVGRAEKSVSARGIFGILLLFLISVIASDPVGAQPCVDPVVNLGPNVVQCGGSVLLDAQNPGSVYQWSDLSSGQTLNVTMSGTYSVTVTNLPSCTASASVDITINAIPVVDLGPDIDHCNSTFRDFLYVGIPQFAYLWSTGDTTQQIAATTPGNYSVTVTTGAGCTATDNVNIFVRPVPVVNLGPDQTSCGAPVPLSGGVHSNYSWSTGANSQFILASTTGAYSLTVSNAFNCTASSSVNVLFHPSPLLGADVTDSICLYTTADLTGYYVTQGLNVNYGVPNPQAVGPGVYPISVTNQFGCPASATVTINIRQQPDLGSDVVNSICPGTTTDLTTYFNTAGLSVSYLHADNIPVATPHVVSNGIYTVMVSNASGCMDTGLITINLNPKPDLGADRSDSICIGYSYNLTNLYSNPGYSTYVWNTARPDSVSAGVYTLVVSNANGCFDTAHATITNRQQPVVTLTLPTDVCFNEPPFRLTGGTPAGGTYFINGVIDSVFNTLQLGLTIPPHVLYVYTNASGCTDSASRTVTIRPQPFITTTLTPDLCLTSTPLDLDNYFDISAGGSPGTHNYSGLGVSSHFFYPVLVPQSSPVTIQDVYIDIYGCVDTSEFEVTVLTPVNVSLISSVASHSICEGESVTFTGLGADTYAFFVNGQPVTQQPSTEPTYTTNTLQDKDIVTVVGYNICSSDTSEPFVYDVHPLPFVDAGPDTTISLGTSIQLNGDARGDDLVMYEWRPTTNLNFPNLPNPTYNGPDSIQFFFYATDAFGCSNFDSVMINVVVPDSIELPNVITPDGDGKNDTWRIHPRVDLTGSNLIIFNRWGTKVYEVETYNNDWGGTNKGGEKLPDGTYYYVFRVPSQNDHIYRGAINILNGTAK